MPWEEESAILQLENSEIQQNISNFQEIKKEEKIS